MISWRVIAQHMSFSIQISRLRLQRLLNSRMTASYPLHFGPPSDGMCDSVLTHVSVSQPPPTLQHSSHELLPAASTPPVAKLSWFSPDNCRYSAVQYAVQCSTVQYRQLQITGKLLNQRRAAESAESGRVDNCVCADIVPQLGGFVPWLIVKLHAAGCWILIFLILLIYLVFSG